MPFRTALSGLNASAADLRVIGNNVANTGTTGFKKSRAEFADIYPATNLGASANAIGAGVRISAVTQQFSQGNIDFTDNVLDLAVNGSGFFRMSDSGAILYSRSGAFQVDNAGFIVNNQQQRLTGFQADAAGNITGSLGDLFLNKSDIAPNETTTVDVGVNLNSEATVIPAATVFDPTDPTSYTNSSSLTIYDSLGSSHLATTYYRKTAPNTWDTFTFINGADIYGVGAPPYTADAITFNPDGSFATPIGGTVTYPGFNPGTGANNLVLTYDYSAATPTTQYGGTFGINALTQDGFTSGRLSGIDVGDSGILVARFTNGETRTLGQVALADFSNPQGLQQLGDTTWAETADSGAALTGAPGTSSLGVIQSGALEGSNVDLTEQLVRMITAQRNFQANAQVISTADAITQTIINIR